jgi:hypothetical protein
MYAGMTEEELEYTISVLKTVIEKEVKQKFLNS